MIRPVMKTDAAAIVLLALPSTPALGQASFSIDPLLVQFDADTKNVVMTITNTSAKEIRFELKPFSWDQTPPDGIMELTPTSDIVIFPPLVTMKPHAVQRVRVGTTAAQGPVEKAYRVLVEELPSGQAPAGAATVAVRTRVGLPVFVEPTRITLNGRIDSIRFDKRVVSIPLTNTGTAHTMIDSVVVRGLSGPDQVVFEDSIQGWYVLAGKTRTWQYAMKSAQCRNLKSLEIEVYSQERMLTATTAVPAGACVP